MNIWHDINPDRVKPDDFIAVIEIPKNSKNKYELDKETGLLILDRILFTSTHYPSNYGFIPRTYTDDNDPLDVLVLCSEPISSMSLVKCYPIGYLAMRDQGDNDIKILAIPEGEPMWRVYKDISHLPPHILNEMKHFFNVYKQLEGKKMEVLEVGNAQEAKKIIAESIICYEEYMKKNNNV